MDNKESPKVVLASGSRSRARMLANAGVSFTAHAASVDEATIKTSMQATGADIATVAEILAATKAQQVSRNHKDGLIIGADQMLVCEGKWYDKPVSVQEARDHLKELRGKTHELISSVCVVRDGIVLWHHIGRAKITMRLFSDAFVDDYIKNMGEEILATVGGYELEGLGAQLFNKVDGDYFTVLGMPLLPLLDFLRGHEMVAE